MFSLLNDPHVLCVVYRESFNICAIKMLFISMFIFISPKMVFFFLNFKYNLRNIGWISCCLEHLEVNELRKNAQLHYERNATVKKRLAFFFFIFSIGKGVAR